MMMVVTLHGTLLLSPGGHDDLDDDCDDFHVDDDGDFTSLPSCLRCR